MTFAYEIHYSVGNLKLCKVKHVAKYETMERKVKKSCALGHLPEPLLALWRAPVGVATAHAASRRGSVDKPSSSFHLRSLFGLCFQDALLLLQVQIYYFSRYCNS